MQRSERRTRARASWSATGVPLLRQKAKTAGIAPCGLWAHLRPRSLETAPRQVNTGATTLASARRGRSISTEDDVAKRAVLIATEARLIVRALACLASLRRLLAQLGVALLFLAQLLAVLFLRLRAALAAAATITVAVAIVHGRATEDDIARTLLRAIAFALL